MITKDKSSTLISIFKRKGGEGKHTKIFNGEEHGKYDSLLSLPLLDHEKRLIICYLDSSNWVILTNKRLFYKKNNSVKAIDNENVKKVNLALEVEFRDGVKNKKEFTRLFLQDREGQNHLLVLEKGPPYEGFYQVLHFLSTSTR